MVENSPVERELYSPFFQALFTISGTIPSQSELTEERKEKNYLLRLFVRSLRDLTRKDFS